MNEQLFFRCNSKWGEMIIKITNSGALKGLWFENQKHFPKDIPSEMQLINENNHLQIQSLHQPLRDSLMHLLNELKAYEEGYLSEFTLVLDPDGTAFQKEVWEILQEIPYGQTTTYGEISQKIARNRNIKSMSSQAVGQAVGRNPISIIIPCHRVIGKDGSLTGYAGGVDIKTDLLNIEKLK